MGSKTPFRIQFHVSLIIILGVVVSAMTFVTIAIAFHTGTVAARESAEALFKSSSSLVQERLDNLFGSLINIAEIGSSVPASGGALRGDGLAHPDRSFFQSILDSHRTVYSMYMGYPNGDFFQIINAGDNPGVAAAQSAPDSTCAIIRSIAGQGEYRKQVWTYMDSVGNKLGTRVEANPAYDPRTRSWYSGAMKGTECYLSDPYLFNSLNAPGITAARAMTEDRAVIGVDLTLTSLKEFVKDIGISKNAFLLIYGPDRNLLAASPNAAEVLGEEPVLMAPPGIRAEALLASGRNSNAKLPSDPRPFFCDVNSGSAVGSASLLVLTAAPLSDFMGSLQTLRRNVLLLALVALAIFLPATLVLARNLSSMLIVIAGDAERISRFDFSACDHGSSIILEFNQLSEAFGVMKHTIFARTEVLNDTQEKLERLVNLGINLSALDDIDELCEKILRGAMDLTLAEGGSLYLRGTKEKRDELEFKIVLNDKLAGINQGGASGKPVSLPSVPLFDPDGGVNAHNVVTDAFHKSKAINIADAGDYVDYDFSGTRQFDQLTGYHSVSFLTVPLKPLGQDAMGALQLINARDPENGEVIPFDARIEGLVQALSAQAATALYNQKLIGELGQLFESMIDAIADAIDAKSPYTGGHNKRVPVIAKMLAREADRASTGRLASWSLGKGNGEWQFHIASMLHDCGKITTPDYVVDKATKLETIYNRIHEIRTRFEVLLRDAMIEHRERLIAGDRKEEADAWLEDVKRSLQEDFAFLAEANLGGEFMAPERIERLKAIASRRWMRYFDDTLGLSKEELQLSPTTERTPLPAEETLLADKPRHRIPQDAGFSDRYAGYGFRIDIPEFKYNRGELYNLAIARGTLTAEERYKINEHSMQTIVMLNRLCEGSEHLKDVVQWAGSHHENLQGTGYPRRHAADELPIAARIMTIADIFEALTASDRPYKPAKTLSEAVGILFEFKKNGHIDPDLFDLFLSSGVYREYGEKYLARTQLDEVDIDAYVGRLT
jgi:HD-GYP domain-containing protein (c-di-GMP phosphodiesterase class II)